MHPTFYLGPLEFPAYFTFLTIGYLAAVMLAWRQTFKTSDIDPNKLLDLSVVLLVGGLVGARLLHVIADGSFDDYVNLCVDPLKVKGEYLPGGALCTSDAECAAAEKGELCNLAAGTCHQGRDCLRWIKVWYGGLAFYGSLVVDIPLGIWYAQRHRKRLPLWKVSDLAGFAIPLGLAFGRIGCWCAGCCFGRVTSHPIGVVFPKYSPAWDRHIELGLLDKSAPHSLPVIPTQLFHAASNFLIFLFCFWMYKKWRRFDGVVFWTFMALYAVSRFILEFWRDDHRGVWLGETLSTSQIIAIPALITAVVMLLVLRKRPTPASAPSS